MTTEDILAQDIRDRMKKGFMSQLDDATLVEVYKLVQADTNYSELARWMRARGLAQDITDLSLPKLIAKFKKQVTPLLIQQKVRRNTIHLPDLKSLDPVSRLQTIIHIYSDLIHGELQSAAAGAPMDQGLSKHVLALSAAEKRLMELKTAQDQRWNLNDMPFDVKNRLLTELFSTMENQFKTFKSAIDTCDCIMLECDEAGNPIQ
jgi:hypothetical protein